MEQYSVQDALVHARAHCANHPNWQPICDIENTNNLSLSFSELPAKIQNDWRRHYPVDPEEAWAEFGIAPSRHPFKHVTGKGELFDSALDVPLGHQSMMIFDLSKAREGGYLSLIHI